MRRLSIALVVLFALCGHTTAAGAQALPTFRLTDVTATSGVAFKHISSPDKRYIVESMSGGVALIDYDNDGLPDIYLVNSLTVDLVKSGGKTRSALYHNDGDGTFTDVTDKAGLGDVGWGMGCAVGDFDNDGFDDIYVTCVGPNRLYRNNGNGTFTDVTAKANVGDPRWSSGAAFVDYDRDGDLDLFVANYIEFDFAHLPEFGKDKTCQYKGIAVQCGPRGLPGAGDTLYRNNGDGTFTDVSVAAGVSDPNKFYGLGVLCSDIDDDGYPDIYVANDSTPNFLYRNNGDGTFKEIGFVSATAVNENGSEQGSMGVTWGDYNHDGKLDLFVTNFADEYNTLYRAIGKGTYEDVSYAAKLAAGSLVYVGWGTKFVDLDDDGWVDLFAVNGHVYPQLPNYKQRDLVYRNLRDGTFAEIGAQMGASVTEARVGRGVAFGDLDNDGDVDLVINNLDGAAQVLRNDGGNANNAVIVKTVGVKSNRDGIGAKVKVVSGDLTQIDEVRSGGSYISQNDLRLHFGLERRAKVDTIEVRWPSGAVDTVTDVPANSIVTIKEGAGIVDRRDFAKPKRASSSDGRFGPTRSGLAPRTASVSPACRPEARGPAADSSENLALTHEPLDPHASDIDRGTALGSGIERGTALGSGIERGAALGSGTERGAALGSGVDRGAASTKLRVPRSGNTPLAVGARGASAPRGAHGNDADDDPAAERTNHRGLSAPRPSEFTTAFRGRLAALTRHGRATASGVLPLRGTRSFVDAAPRSTPEPNAAPRSVPEPNAAPRSVPEPNAAPRSVPELNAAPRSVPEPEAVSRSVPELNAVPRSVLEPNAIPRSVSESYVVLPSVSETWGSTSPGVPAAGSLVPVDAGSVFVVAPARRELPL